MPFHLNGLRIALLHLICLTGVMLVLPMNAMMARVDHGLIISFEISSIQTVELGSILSDHMPLSFLLHLDCVLLPVANHSNKIL